MKTLLRFLTWVRVTDRHDGLVSLTNVGLILLLVKIAGLKSIELPDLAAFFLALLAYSYKRQAGKPAATAVAPAPVDSFDGAALQAKVKDLEAFVTTVKLSSGLGPRRG